MDLSAAFRLFGRTLPIHFALLGRKQKQIKSKTTAKFIEKRTSIAAVRAELGQIDTFLTPLLSHCRLPLMCSPYALNTEYFYASNLGKLCIEIHENSKEKICKLHYSSLCSTGGQCCGSGSGMGKNKIRIRVAHPGSYFRELRKFCWGLKYINSLMRIQISDPVSF